MGIRTAAHIRIVKSTVPGAIPLTKMSKKSPPKKIQEFNGFTAKDVKALESFQGFNGTHWSGFGYLGSGERSSRSDKYLAMAANELGLDREELFLWVDSSYGRHFMDDYADIKDAVTGEWRRMTKEEIVQSFKEEVAKGMPSLVEEVGYSKPKNGK